MDLSRLATPSRGPARNRSIYDDWVDKLNKEEREAVLTAARNRNWGHTALLAVLLEEGAPKISANSFQTWRHKIGLPR